MKNSVLAGLCGVAILMAGCSTPQRSDVDTLQGAWVGRITQGNPEHQCSFVISGTNYEFHDVSDASVWYKGTFTLREDTTPRQYVAFISECPFPKYVGKTSMAIYRLESGTLTITGNGPGNPSVPLAFDTTDAARMELKRK
jgi:uncharacterized protein (TIGR03067 family)